MQALPPKTKKFMPSTHNLQTSTMKSLTHLCVRLKTPPLNSTDQIIMENFGWSWPVMEHAKTNEQKLQELDKEHIMGIDTHTTSLSGLRAHAKAPIEQN